MTHTPTRDTGLYVQHYTPSEVPFVWDEAHELLERAIKISGGRYSTSQTLHELLIGKTTLWVVRDESDTAIAAWVLRIIEFPGRKTMYGDLLGGDRLNEWASLMDETVIEWAKKFRCTHIEIGGRDGWIRYAKPHGYEKAYWVIEKAVDYEEED